MLPDNSLKISGRHQWLDHELVELGFFGSHLWHLGCVPGNGGDISVLLPVEVQAAFVNSAGNSGSEVRFDSIPDLSRMRGDKRPYYRAQAIGAQLLSEAGLEPLDGRAILATVSGGKIWDLERKPEQHLCVISINVKAKTFTLLYGNTEYANVPTTEFVNHLIAHARNLCSSLTTSAVVHVHPQHTIDLSRHPLAASFQSFNHILYSQRPELLANLPDLVGLVPYQAPGSTSLVKATISAIHSHRAITWKGHGVLIREASVERCVDLLEYIETSAAAALRNLSMGGELQGLSPEDIESFIEVYGLPNNVLDIITRNEGEIE